MRLEQNDFTKLMAPRFFFVEEIHTFLHYIIIKPLFLFFNFYIYIYIYTHTRFLFHAQLTLNSVGEVSKMTYFVQ